MTSWRARLSAPDGMALAILAAVVALLVHPALTGHVPAMRDMPGFTLPSRAFWRDAILHGQLPAWDPFVALGVPVFAAPVHGALYPGHVLLLLGPLATSFGLTWALHAWWGAAGGYALARSCGCRAPAALVSGLVWGVGGYALAMWWNGEKTLSCAWVPWVVWGVRRVARAPRALGPELAVAAAAGAMLCAAGDPFLLFDVVLLAVPVAYDALPPGDRQRFVRVLLRTGATMAFALLLAAPVLLPALVLRSETERATAFSRAVAEAWSLHPVRWLEAIVPLPLGDPMKPETYPGAPYSDDAYVQVLPWAVSLYAGAPTLALATLAPRRTLKVLGLGGAFAALVALGRHTPVHGLLLRALPPLSLSRYPEKHVLVVVGVMALLASKGLERVLRGEVKLRVLAALAAVALGVALVAAPEPLRGTTHAGAIHAALALLATLGALAATAREARAAWLVPLVLACDLGVAGRPLLAWLPAGALDTPPLAREVLALPHELPPRVYRPRDFDADPIATLSDDAGGLFGIAAIPGHDPARAPLPDIAPLAGNAARLEQWMRLDAVVLPGRAEGQAARLVHAAPRAHAWMTARVEPARVGDVAARLADPSFDPEGTALVEPLVAGALGDLAQAPPRALGACSFTQVALAEIAVGCDTPSPALLVIAEGAASGWEAEVDGAPAPLVRADGIFRGVPLGAGRHGIRVRYEVPGLLPGSLILLLAALVLALGALRASRAPPVSNA